MKCPVCGDDCVRDAQEIIDILPSVFSRCPECRFRILDKNNPLPNRFYQTPCICGKRFIDEVYAQLYVIFTEEGIFTGDEPLKAVGSPLTHPGFFMKFPPFLPENSLVLLSKHPSKKVAERIIREVPEIKGVVKSDDFVPGISDPDFDGIPNTYTLLAGCDIRANVFDTKKGPIVLYKQQSTMHIEFPRKFNPKIEGVEKRIETFNPEYFVDACCGAGTLGLTAARMGVPHIIMNDLWYAAAFWTAYNMQVNREYFKIEDVSIYGNYKEMKGNPVVREPWLVAETTGAQEMKVFQGDYTLLHTVLPDTQVLAVIDLFEKTDMTATTKIMGQWREHVAGEVFIP
jgi:hypothetical protein